MKIITNREELLEAIKKLCFTLEYASEELKNDKEIVLTAVKKSGLALKYASERLKLKLK